MPKRKRVDDELAAEISFAVDLRCCLCEHLSELPPRVRNGQIHHLDGNPSNNAIDNLVWLCIEHHEDVGKVGRASRRMSPAVIRRYQKRLQKLVQQRLRAADSKRKERPAFYQALDAHGVVDLGKLRFRTGDEWGQVHDCLSEVGWYPDEIGYEARKAILDYLIDITGRARDEMPTDIAVSVRRRALDLLPIRFLRAHRRRRTTAEDLELMGYGIDIGMGLAYDGALHLHNLRIVDNGCEVLW